MPKQYPPNQKRRALELLELYNFNLSIVQRLTGIPHTTLSRWRDEHLHNSPDLSGKKSFPFPEKRTQTSKSSPKTPKFDSEPVQSDQSPARLNEDSQPAPNQTRDPEAETESEFEDEAAYLQWLKGSDDPNLASRRNATARRTD